MGSLYIFKNLKTTYLTCWPLRTPKIFRNLQPWLFTNLFYFSVTIMICFSPQKKTFYFNFSRERNMNVLFGRNQCLSINKFYFNFSREGNVIVTLRSMINWVDLFHPLNEIVWVELKRIFQIINSQILRN